MSVTVYGRHDDDAVFEDDNGPARVPLRALAMLHHAADMGRFPRLGAGHAFLDESQISQLIGDLNRAAS